jgi:S1-C subfamily serine protease
MTDLPEASGSASSPPRLPQGPPPPEWITPPPSPPGPVWPAGPAGPADAAPNAAGRSEPPWRRTAAVLTTAFLIAGLVGVAIGSRLSDHAARPTLSATDQAPSATTTPASPTNPLPVLPAPGTGSGGSGNGTPSAGSGASPGAAAIATNLNASIVDVNTVLGYQNGSGAGTGMILSASGEILTNNHVIDSATSISVTLVSTGRRYNATVVGTDPTEDIAVLQLTGASGLTPIRTGNSSGVAIGDAVVAIGNALGAGGTPAAVAGTVEGINKTITASDTGGANAETLNGLIEMNAPIQPGDSGGPLVNSAGDVIGMNTAASAGRRFQTAATVGFAIPINKALDVASQIESGRASATIHLGLPGFLGVAISSSASTQSGTGAVVARVQPTSPAANTGLSPGDTITSIDGQAVASAQGLSALTRSHHPGDRVRVAWIDSAGAAHQATVTLATGPAD